MSETILILGGGAFGLSTALELVKGKYEGKGHLITILDRSATPPATDAASSDYNKVSPNLMDDSRTGWLTY